ncbi:hypothetical protein PGB90_005000 [Kerria lacca]
MIKVWLVKSPEGMKMDNSYIKTILFAVDQVIFANSEDDLQKSINCLGKVAEEYGMKISAKKSKR